MTPETILPYIVPTILAILQVILGVSFWREKRRLAVAQAKKTENEADKEGAGAAHEIVVAAGEVAGAQRDTLKNVAERLKQVEAHSKEQDKEIAGLKRTIREKNNVIADLQQYIKDLSAQVVSLHGIPVEMKRRFIDRQGQSPES